MLQDCLKKDNPFKKGGKMNEFITIEKNSFSEFTEKKSKFIGSLFYLESVEEAEKIIKQTRKKYFDAKHNCIAYREICQLIKRMFGINIDNC